MLNINVGILGHVDSGKTSLVKALSTVLSTASLDKHPQVGAFACGYLCRRGGGVRVCSLSNPGRRSCAAIRSILARTPPYCGHDNAAAAPTHPPR